MDRTTPVSFTIRLDQLDRLMKLSQRTRLNRSVILRDILDGELEHYEKKLGNNGNVVGGGPVVVAVGRRKTNRRP